MSEIDFIADLLADVAAMVRQAHGDRAARTPESKGDPADLLTATDLAVQRRITDAIGRAYPADAIMAEEGDHAEYPADRDGRCWICDPIDGTHNFVRSLFGTFAVSLGLVERGEPIAAGVALPSLEAVLIAARGEGATMNGRPVRVSSITDLAAAKIEIDFQRPQLRHRILDATDRVLRGAGQIRSQGSAVVGLTSVATGDAEAYLHTHLRPWDCAAAAGLITEAGGRVTRFDGSPLDLFAETCDILATNGVIHDRLLALVTPPPPC